jgi:hypothetical protein
MAMRLLEKGPHSKREALLMLDLEPEKECVQGRGCDVRFVVLGSAPPPLST